MTQRAHGLLAAQLAAHWRIKDRGERWTETLIAIADHDDAQIELQRDDLLTAQGGPVDFKMIPFALEHGMRTMEFALSKSRYVAVLCAIHLEFVAGDRSLQSEAVKKFLKTQKTLSSRWCKQLNITSDEIKFYYRLLEWCDALSLLICQRDNQPEQRSVEISRGPDDEPYQLIQSAPDVLMVTPWPFEDDQFKIRFERRLLQQLQFDSCEHFKSAFLKTNVEEKTWTIKR